MILLLLPTYHQNADITKLKFYIIEYNRKSKRQLIMYIKICYTYLLRIYDRFFFLNIMMK